MTISYPRDFPDVPFAAASCDFDADPLGTISRTAGGRIAFQQSVGGGLWRAKYTSKPLNETDFGRWHAWKLSLRGATYTFKGYDVRRCYPIRYGAGILALGGGTCRITAVAGETITIDSLAPSFVFTEGDYVSFPWLGGQVLVKALETLTATVGGVIASIAVDPWLRTGGTLPADGTFVRPWCEMKIVPGSWSGTRQVREPISFEAIQHKN